MSGNVVPATNIYLKTAPGASNNSLFQVFGTPGGNNLGGLAQIAYSTGATPPPFSAATTPTVASGNLKMSFFAGKSAYIASPSVSISALTASGFTPSVTGAGTNTIYIALGTAAGGLQTANWQSWSTGAITATITQGTSYYISTYLSNSTLTTTSLSVSNTNAFGIPNKPISPSATLTNLSNWSLSWTAPSTGIAPTSYSWILSNINASTQLATGTTAGTSVTGTTVLTQGCNYQVFVTAVRPEWASGAASQSNSGSSSLNPPTAVSGVDVTAISTTAYTPTVSGGAGGTIYIYFGTSSIGTPGIVYAATSTSTTITPGTTYYLRALSSNTTTYTVTPIVSTIVGIPTAPASATLTLSNLSRFKIDWGAVTGVQPSTYNWYLSTTNNKTGQVTSGTGVTGTGTGDITSYTLTQDTNYYAIVYTNKSPNTETASVASGASNLASPSAVSGVDVTAISTTAYTPTVSGGAGGTIYIYFGTSSSDTPTTPYAATSTSTPITQGTTYYLRARSSNTTTNTVSPIVSTIVGIPTAPASATLTLTSLSSWSISWVAPTGVAPSSYNWYLSTTNSKTNAVASNSSVTGTGSGNQTTALSQNTDYYAIVYTNKLPNTETASVASGSNRLASPTAPTTYTLSNLTTSSAKTNVTGGTETYFLAIGTTSGATNVPIGTTSGGTCNAGYLQVTDATTVYGAFTVGSNYYVTYKSSNLTTGTVSGTVTSSALVIPVAPTFTTNSNYISNTTFNVAATTTTTGATIAYSISPSTGISGSGPFTGLAENTSYTVTATASTAYSSNTATFTAISLAAPSALRFAPDLPVSGGNASGGLIFSWTDNATASNVTGITIYAGTASAALTSKTTYQITGSPGASYSVAAGGTFVYLSNTAVSLYIKISGSNTSWTSPTQYFMFVPGGGTGTATVGATTLKVWAQGGSGHKASYYSQAGCGALIQNVAMTVTAGTLKVLAGEAGKVSSSEGVLSTAAACGDNSLGGKGGRAYLNGIAGGGGGAATIVRAPGAAVVLGGGGGNGGSYSAYSGFGGYGTIGSGGGYVAGTDGFSYAVTRLQYGHNGGWGGSQIACPLGSTSSEISTPDPKNSLAPFNPGSGGGGWRGTANYITSLAYGTDGTSASGTGTANNITAGNGGDGAQFYGIASGGGGGGWGGGGGGNAVNQGSTLGAAGGGGGGSYCSVACEIGAGLDNTAGFGFVAWT
jgi:hypothetical protein